MIELSPEEVAIVGLLEDVGLLGVTDEVLGVVTEILVGVLL